MLIIMGKTASGKDLVVSRLVSDYGYKKMVTYTTRPMRKGEVPDVTYHYISEADFFEKVSAGFFAEYRKYDTIHGTWYYGSAKKDYEVDSDKTVVILTPSGVKEVLGVLDRKPTIIYLYANIRTVKERLIKRGDDNAEAERRVMRDIADFKDAPEMADRIVYNNGDRDVDEVVEEIIKLL